MKNSLIPTFVAMMLFALCQSQTVFAADSAGFEAFLPEDTLMYAEIDLSDGAVKALKRLSLWKVYQDPMIQAKVEEELEKSKKEIKKAIGLSTEDLKSMLGGKMAIAIPSVRKVKKQVPDFEADPDREMEDLDLDFEEEGQEEPDEKVEGEEGNGPPMKTVTESEPNLLILFDAGPNSKKLQANVAKIIQTAIDNEERIRKNETFKGVPYQVLIDKEKTKSEKQVDGKNMEWNADYLAFLPNGWCSITQDEKTLKDLISRVKGAGFAPLSKHRPFRVVQKRFKDCQVFAYASFSGLMEMNEATGGEEAEEMTKAVMKAMGLDESLSIGYGVYEDKGALKFRSFMPMQDMKAGLMGIFNAEAPKKALAIVPEDAVVFGGGKIDPMKMWNGMYAFMNQILKMQGEDPEDMKQTIAQFEAAMGISIKKDVLAALGGEFFFYLPVQTLEGESKAKDGLNEPALEMVFGLTIRGAAGIDKIIKAISLRTGQNPKTEKYKNFNVMERRIAYSEDYLLVASTERALRQAIDLRDGEGKPISSRAGFRRAIASLDGAHKWLLYCDAKSLCSLIAQGIKMSAEQKARWEPEGPIRGKERKNDIKGEEKESSLSEDNRWTLKLLDMIAKRLEYVVYAQVDDPDGFLIEAVIK